MSNGHNMETGNSNNKALMIGDGGSNPGSPRSSTPSSPSDNSSQGKRRHFCLCSPTTHVGSFRCRLHRSTSSEWEKAPSTPRSPTSPSKPELVTDPASPDKNSICKWYKEGQARFKTNLM